MRRYCCWCVQCVIGRVCLSLMALCIAPVVSWNNGASQEGGSTDRWSRTYVTKEKPPQATSRSTTTSTTTSPVSSPPTKRFPQPANALGSRVSAHIASTTTGQRPSAHLKRGSSAFRENPSAHPDILPSPHNSELAKVYGSVLQRKDTLSTFHCHICHSSFPPDATIYPDPNDETGKLFMCKPCFTVNGGSAGDCDNCKRPVLILKAEGGFVENAGKVWHKKCFVCSGCGKSIGDQPLVDLLGYPSCADCFDSTCLSHASARRLCAC